MYRKTWWQPFLSVPVLLGMLLSGCYLVDSRTEDTIPTVTLAPRVPSDAAPLFIVLPGRGDDLGDLRQSGIGDAIQQAIPEAEVILVGATLAYYREGRLISRLHDEIIAPARARGVTEIWMAGISLGGVGTILYEHDYPGELHGLVLFSPYMGESDLVDEVAVSGGPGRWVPGSVPDKIDAKSATRLEWVTAQRWARDSDLAQRVWLACGTTDQLRRASDLLAPLLPEDQVFNPPGGHEWKVWLPASRVLFARIEAARLPRS